MESSIVVNGNSKALIKDLSYQESCDFAQSAEVLGVTATAKVIATETSDRECRVTVLTTFNAVCCDEEGSFRSETESVESVKTVPCYGMTPMTKAHLVARVTDCEKTSSSPTRARATVVIGGYFVQEQTVELLDPSTEGLLCKTETVKVENAIALPSETIRQSYTEEARMPIVTVLDSYGTVSVNDVFPANGSYRAEGEINVRILAVTDNGQFISQVFSHDFTAECAQEGLMEEMRLDVEAELRDLTFSVTESDKRVLVCDAEISVFGVAIEEKEVEKTTDVYSLQNELTVEEGSYVVGEAFCLRHGREKATATVTVAGVGEILGVLTPCVSVGLSATPGTTVEGSVQAVCLYLDDNGMKQAVKQSIPFSATMSDVCDTFFAPEADVLSVSARPRGSKEIELTAEVTLTVRGSKERELRVIGGVTAGAEKEEDDYAICLYVVKEGETLWDVAKALNTEESVLEKLNPDVALPLRGGEKLLLYREKAE